MHLFYLFIYPLYLCHIHITYFNCVVNLGLSLFSVKAQGNERKVCCYDYKQTITVFSPLKTWQTSQVELIYSQISLYLTISLAG